MNTPNCLCKKIYENYPVISGKPQVSRLLCDSEEHRAEVGYEPDNPHEDAELVKIEDGLFIFLEQNHQCPGGMDEHQQDGEQPGDAVNVKGHPADILEHHASADGITDEAQDKEGEVPPFEAAEDAFAPDADGVEDQCGGEDDAG